ncbi:NAD(P)-dependent alcohol dehydrogenase [Streptomyces sedi]|uniref:NAD(P)-dependent alcohol dehydrogenase n=1 Tax=Streptomyces sedi TaxID=555059 RepID=A0A5C4VEZ5_9ACTN|nr:NAD(P)-dependent alcohol dehydrogenase [Streptomyces sedi]TNM34484.1 NAD(P)-dependent alcohol dehydrogenase [Streptomyces sedi]
MLAARYHRHGPPEVLRVEEVPEPEPAAGQVRVRVHATSVNGGDLHARAGRLRWMSRRRPPFGTGLDISGEVDALGPGVTDLAVGQRVWGALPRSAVFAPVGAAAEATVVEAARLGPLPEGIDPARAAALPGVGTTAVNALLTRGRLRAGQRLLVRGGAGGVGSAAVVLGHALGAHVTALAGESTLEAVRALGADEALDYREARPAELERFDVILDTSGAPGLPGWHRRLRPRGRMVTIAPTHPRTAVAILLSTVHGPRRMRFFSGDIRRADLDALAAHVTRGELRPVVASTHALAEIADAHRALERGGGVGKRVVVGGATTVRGG